MLNLFKANNENVELLESEDIKLSNTLYFQFRNGLTIIAGKNTLQEGYAQEVYFRGTVFKELPIIISTPIGEGSAKLTNIYDNRAYFITDRPLELNWIVIGFV